MDATFPHLGVYESVIVGGGELMMHIPIAVIWCTPDGHNGIVKHEFVTFHNLVRRNLVSSVSNGARMAVMDVRVDVHER